MESVAAIYSDHGTVFQSPAWAWGGVGVGVEYQSWPLDQALVCDKVTLEVLDSMPRKCYDDGSRYATHRTRFGARDTIW